MHPTVPAALLIALAACTPPQTEVPEATPVPSPGACNAEGYSQFLGRNEEIFARATFPAPMRIIRPGDAVTMDFRPDRLNFDLDADGTITRIWCG